MRLLLVAVDRADADALAALLEDFDVQVVADVRAGMVACRDRRPDLVIGSDEEARLMCRQLRADESLHDVTLHAPRARLVELLVWAVDEVAENQRELERQRTLVESARRHRQELLALVAHELRNPLQSLLLRAQLAEQGDARSSASLPQTVEDKVTSMVLFLGDLIDVERLDAGELTLQRKRIVLEELVRDATTRVAGARARVSLCNRTEVDVDPQRMEQILRNYLTHALAREPAGSCVNVGLERRNGVARVSITDHGSGIGTGDGLFDRHPRGQVPKGVSLYLCRALTELHDGRVGADASLDPQANTVWLELPVARS